MSAPSDRPPKSARWLSRLLMAVGALIILLFFLAVVFVTVLMYPARGEASRADAVLVIAGADDGRHAVAADLIREGYSENMVVSNPLGERDLAGHNMCTGEGVPEGTTTWCMNPEPVSTTGEALTFARLADEQQWDSVVLVTNHPHHQRVRMNFSQCTDLDIDVISVNDLDRSIAADYLLWEFGGYVKFILTQPC